MRATVSSRDLSELLAQVLCLFVVGFERGIGAVVRDQREHDSSRRRPRDTCPRLALGGRRVEGGDERGAGLPRTQWLHGCGGRRESSRTKLVRLTQKGLAARASIGPLLAVVEARWPGATSERDEMERLHAALEALLGEPRLGEGLAPPPTGWRARKPLCRVVPPHSSPSPRAGLPHFPMVTHRGGLARRQLSGYGGI